MPSAYHGYQIKFNPEFLASTSFRGAPDSIQPAPNQQPGFADSQAAAYNRASPLISRSSIGHPHQAQNSISTTQTPFPTRGTARLQLTDTMADITDQHDQTSPTDLDDHVGNGNSAAAESRGIKRQRPSTADDDDDDDEKGGRERRKIEIKFISDKSRRHITFSKRKAGIMKKVSRSCCAAAPLPAPLPCSCAFPITTSCLRREQPAASRSRRCASPCWIR